MTRKNLSRETSAKRAFCEQRMMQARQFVQRQHADERADGAAQHHHDVGRHERHRRAEHRLAADDERIIKRVAEPDQAHALPQTRRRRTASANQPTSEFLKPITLSRP